VKTLTRLTVAIAVLWMLVIGGYSCYLGYQLGVPLNKYTVGDVVHLITVSLGPPGVLLMAIGLFRAAQRAKVLNKPTNNQ
jgi:hypothetical protein